MQEREFDNMIEGRPSNYAEMFELQTRFPSSFPNNLTAEQVAEIEKPVPKEITDKVNVLVKKMKDKKCSDREIRRAVLKKFKIQLVK